MQKTNLSGLVLTSRGLWFKILNLSDDKIYDAQLLGRLKQHDSNVTNLVVVGDYVSFSLDSASLALIHKIKPRKNHVERRDTHNIHNTLIVASNLELTALIVCIKQPRTPLGFIDRVLVELEAFNIPCILIFNKIDLLSYKDSKQLDKIKQMYENIGYPCFKISALKDENLSTLVTYLQDKTTLIIGNSGVGKSTLVNKLTLEADQKTERISKYNEKGKHTTTFGQMFKLQSKGFIIDTPGLKQFGLVDIDQRTIGNYFKEFSLFIKNCKFYNCTHSHEPDCAVIKAVKNNQIHEKRYKSYLNILNDSF